MLEVKNLSKNYGEIKALSDVSFSVDKGEIVGFLGPNGAGKSTAMNIITGYIAPTSGSVSISGFDVASNTKEVKRIVGFLPEIPPLYTEMTVTEFLNFVAELKKVPKKDISNHIKDILERANIYNVKGRLIRNLSKGYRQRVGVAQALVGNPDVIILDEPTVGLDPNQIQEMRKLIKSLKKEHTVILSTHILSEASAVCDKIIIINEGRIVTTETKRDLYDKYSLSNKMFLKIEGIEEKINEVLSGMSDISSISINKSKEEGVAEFVIEHNNSNVRKEIFFAMSELGYPILEMSSSNMSLEEIFMKVVSDRRGGE